LNVRESKEVSEQVIEMSIVNVINPIDILQGIMDECCELHDQCHNCQHTTSCRQLWDKVSEQTYSKPLSVEQTKYFIDEFNHLWGDESISEEQFPGYRDL